MKKIYVFSLLFFTGIISVIILYFYSNQRADTNNGFTRNFLEEKKVFKNKIKLADDYFYIRDVSSDSISFYKFRKPYEWINFTNGFQKKQEITLPIIGKEKFEGMNSVASIDSCSFVLSGRTATAYKILPDLKTVMTSSLDSLPFYQSELINSNSFIFISKVTHQGIFRRKLKKVTWQGEELKSYYPEKQIDGYFCTDGQFKYDKRSGLLIYMYYYRGQFLCLDTNLNVLYYAKTIDTITRAKIFLKVTKNRVIQSTPPYIVNKRISVENNYIYIQSNLKSDNQSRDDFNNFETIDIYSLRTGKYEASFYIPKLEKQKLTDFKIYKNTFIAIYKNNLVTYEIPKLKNKKFT